MTVRYEDQVWKYLVQEVIGVPRDGVRGQIVCQTDAEDISIRFCIDHGKPANVVSVLEGGKIIYRNY